MHASLLRAQDRSQCPGSWPLQRKCKAPPTRDSLTPEIKRPCSEKSCSGWWCCHQMLNFQQGDTQQRSRWLVECGPGVGALTEWLWEPNLPIDSLRWAHEVDSRVKRGKYTGRHYSDGRRDSVGTGVALNSGGRLSILMEGRRCLAPWIQAAHVKLGQKKKRNRRSFLHGTEVLEIDRREPSASRTPTLRN